MLFLRVASILFIVLTLTIAIILVKLLGLQKKGWNFADIAFPMFVAEFYLISDKVYYHSLLPHLVLALSLLAIAIATYFLVKKRDFSYTRFFKFFWRAGFLLTFFLYLTLVIAIFFV
ncbi:DUF3397 domain-containing protein [Streptococcus ovis]|uniref:DUF3397 domain-containing protein n=1 Tax=Streptococcus ovis TaxID=82806 RepID=UPI00035FB038|nr:DUF3397 domain-containing protein [Streptococcus ovis]